MKIFMISTDHKIIGSANYWGVLPMFIIEGNANCPVGSEWI